MTAASRLREHLPQILLRLERFARVRREIVPDLIAHLERTLQVAPKRAAAAIRVSQERSQKIEAGIRLAVGALPLPERKIAELVQARIARKGLKAYGLTNMPCARVIRRTARKIMAERIASLSMTTVSPERNRAGYASTMHQSATLQST